MFPGTQLWRTMLCEPRATMMVDIPARVIREILSAGTLYMNNTKNLQFMFSKGLAIAQAHVQARKSRKRVVTSILA